MREWADYITAKFDKDILIMETGYSWDKTLPDNTPGQLAHNGPYPDFSPLGQKNFMLELIKEIKQLKTAAYLVFFIGILSSSKWKVWDGNWVPRIM